MKIRTAVLVFVAAMVTASSAILPARADSVQIEGVTITSSDVSRLLTALHTALQPNDSTIPLAVTLKQSNEMPAYDQQWHYAGMREDKVRTMDVWLNADLKGAEAETAIEAAFLLALTDGGYGGTAFKQLYDTYASKDAQLPPDATDPFVNQHKLAAALVKLVQ